MLNLFQLDLASLRLLVLTADSENLTKAAGSAHMTVSAASKRLAELERVTDCTLFIRLPRGLQLTPAGRGLAEHARLILEGAHRMARDASDYSNGVLGHVRLFANTSAVIQFLPQDLNSFLASNPQVRIGMEEALSEMTVQAIEDGRADLGIFSDNIPAPNLEKRLYRRDKLVLLVPREHPFAQREEISFVETLDYDYVALNQGSSLLKRISDAATTASRLLKVRIQVTSFEGIYRMIDAGLGIGILPLGSVHTGLLENKLKAIPLTDPWASRKLFVGISANARLTPEAANLFNFLTHLE
ncbi:LysR family transcriptional regulator [Pseudomonas gingeri]|uniref:LysR family transcriptional regulator n=1 Tax=Pseudomonas gingeri TaxID=117681 RepID=UPI0015A28144|nr:LysR family transcriptional regulator [Pseudomonas gingeri]NVZ75976.1 LysR family transcriptional regulator [Pseudomonas gingeri]